MVEAAVADVGGPGGEPARDRRRRAVLHGRHPGGPAARGSDPRAVRDPRGRRRRRAPLLGAVRRGARAGHDRRRRASGRAPGRSRPRGGGGRWVEVPSLEVSSTDLRARAVGRTSARLPRHPRGGGLDRGARPLPGGAVDRPDGGAGPTGRRRHFPPADHGPSRRWMIVFSPCSSWRSSPAARSPTSGSQTVRKSRRRQERLDGDRSDAARVRGVPRAHADAARAARLGSPLISVAVLALNSGDVGGSVLLVPPARVLDRRRDAVSLGGVVGLRGLADRRRCRGCSRCWASGSPRWWSSTTPGGRSSSHPSHRSPSRTPTPWASSRPAPLSLDGRPGRAVPRRAQRGRERPGAPYRQQLFFEAWAQAVAAVAGSRRRPRRGRLGHRALRAGPRRRTASGRPPCRWSRRPSGVGTRPPGCRPGGRERAHLGAGAVPHRPVPGGRVRVRLLDGRGDPDHVLPAAPLIVPADSEIVVVGNADAFDYQTTEIRYHHPTVRAGRPRRSGTPSAPGG